MPLTRVVIHVPNAPQVHCDFEYIKVYRADTQYGTYNEITDDGTRIALCDSQFFYDYDDEDGTEYSWYKWKFTSIDGDSRFYGPIQGYFPYTTYCTFEDVQRILRSSKPTERIQFGRYQNLRQGKTNTSSIRLKEVTFGQEYSGEEKFTITFTSTTEFKVEVGEKRDLALRLLGTGDTATDFTSDDSMLFIKSSSWINTPAAIDDTIEFQSMSHMSISDAIRFIQDAEVLCDVIIEENIRFSTEARKDLRFQRGDVPKAVKKAAMRFAAFFIWTTIYNEQAISGLPSSINDISIGDRRVNDLSSWAKQAIRYLEGFIKKYTENFDPETGTAVVSAPRWRGMDSLFDAVGVAYVGEGLKLPEFDVFKERSQMSYEGLLDDDLMQTGAFSLWRTDATWRDT